MASRPQIFWSRMQLSESLHQTRKDCLLTIIELSLRKKARLWGLPLLDKTVPLFHKTNDFNQFNAAFSNLLKRKLLDRTTNPPPTIEQILTKLLAQFTAPAWQLHYCRFVHVTPLQGQHENQKCLNGCLPASMWIQPWQASRTLYVGGPLGEMPAPPGCLSPHQKVCPSQR